MDINADLSKQTLVSAAVFVLGVKKVLTAFVKLHYPAITTIRYFVSESSSEVKLSYHLTAHCFDSMGVEVMFRNSARHPVKTIISGFVEYLKSPAGETLIEPTYPFMFVVLKDLLKADTAKPLAKALISQYVSEDPSRKGM